jgi:hypothetical protein
MLEVIAFSSNEMLQSLNERFGDITGDDVIATFCVFYFKLQLCVGNIEFFMVIFATIIIYYKGFCLLGFNAV